MMMTIDAGGPMFERRPDGSFVVTPQGPVRIGAVGRGVGSVDYTAPAEAIRYAEKEILASITGIAPRNIIMLNQVHGDDIVIIDHAPVVDRPWHADADGLITRETGICLVIRTADCVPVFAYDPASRVLGAAHAGWRGCRAGIAAKLVRTMRERFDARPERMASYILPSIGPDSYSVQEDVAGLFPRDIIRKRGSMFLNLWTNIERGIVESGVPAENVFNARRCTLIERDSFFSHRNGDAGRNLNYAYII